jgi:hypothetical protein
MAIVAKSFTDRWESLQRSSSARIFFAISSGGRFIAKICGCE